MKQGSSTKAFQEADIVTKFPMGGSLSTERVPVKKTISGDGTAHPLPERTPAIGRSNTAGMDHTEDGTNTSLPSSLEGPHSRKKNDFRGKENALAVQLFAMDEDFEMRQE